MTDFSLHTQRDYTASADELWALLAPVQDWQEWNHSFWFSRADFREGGKALLWVRLGLARLPVPVKFQTIEPGRELRWHGGNPRIGYGSHYLRIEPIDDTRCRLHHGEDFAGLAARAGAPVLKRFGALPYERMLADIATQLEG